MYVVHSPLNNRCDFLTTKHLFQFPYLFFLRNSSEHFGQNHLPFGFVVSPTQAKWNHSMGHSSLSHPIISPYDTWWHRQYVGSLGSTGMSSTSLGCGVSPPADSDSVVFYIIGAKSEIRLVHILKEDFVNKIKDHRKRRTTIEQINCLETQEE